MRETNFRMKRSTYVARVRSYLPKSVNDVVSTGDIEDFFEDFETPRYAAKMLVKQVGGSPSAWHGVWYWRSANLARAWAEANGWPTDRILEFGRGWAVQAGRSGNYAGPGSLKPEPWTGWRQGGPVLGKPEKGASK